MIKMVLKYIEIKLASENCLTLERLKTYELVTFHVED